jgi:hypothetical protein
MSSFYVCFGVCFWSPRFFHGILGLTRMDSVVLLAMTRSPIQQSTFYFLGVFVFAMCQERLIRSKYV